MMALKELENKLRKLSPKTSQLKWIPEKYIGAGESKYLFLNIKVRTI